MYCRCNCHCVVDKLLKFRTDGFSTRGLYGSMYAKIFLRESLLTKASAHFQILSYDGIFGGSFSNFKRSSVDTYSTHIILYTPDY